MHPDKMLCFSRLTYAVVKVLPDFKSNDQSLDLEIEPSILSTKFVQVKSFTSIWNDRKLGSSSGHI